MLRLGFCLLLCSGTLVRGRTIELHQKRAALILSAATLTTDRKIRLSDTLKLRILVQGGLQLEVALEPLEVDTKQWSLLDQVTDLGSRPWEKSYTLDPLQPGKLPLPLVMLRYREGPGQEWLTVRWADELLEVVGPGDRQSAGIRGDMPLEPLPEPPGAGRPFPWWIIPASVAGLLFLGYASWWLRRPRPEVVLPPGERALRDLERLQNAPAPHGQPGWLHARVSAIVRVYLEERFGLPAPRQTTEEVLLAVRQPGPLGEDDLRDIEELCRICDRAKFAGAQPAAEQSEEVLALARRIIEQTMAKPAA